jgi:hypothetical protein
MVDSKQSIYGENLRELTKEVTASISDDNEQQWAKFIERVSLDPQDVFPEDLLTLASQIGRWSKRVRTKFGSRSCFESGDNERIVGLLFEVTQALRGTNASSLVRIRRAHAALRLTEMSPGQRKAATVEKVFIALDHVWRLKKTGHLKTKNMAHSLDETVRWLLSELRRIDHHFRTDAPNKLHQKVRDILVRRVRANVDGASVTVEILFACIESTRGHPLQNLSQASQQGQFREAYKTFGNLGV